MRKVPLVTNNIYHIFNRGVNKGDIFFSGKDYKHFLSAAKHYLTKNSKYSYEKSSINLNEPGSSASSALSTLTNPVRQPLQPCQPYKWSRR